jgi:hypothetical protein
MKALLLTAGLAAAAEYPRPVEGNYVIRDFRIALGARSQR